MLLVAWLFYAGHLGNYLVLIAVFMYIGGFACTWGAVLWVYIAEMFPDSIRGSATAVAAFGNWTMNAVISFTFPILLAKLGAAPTFLLYALFNAGMVWFVSRYIFETKGVPLEKVEELYHTI
jgi:MFS family permease